MRPFVRTQMKKRRRMERYSIMDPLYKRRMEKYGEYLCSIRSLFPPPEIEMASASVPGNATKEIEPLDDASPKMDTQNTHEDAETQTMHAIPVPRPSCRVVVTGTGNNIVCDGKLLAESSKYFAESIDFLQCLMPDLNVTIKMDLVPIPFQHIRTLIGMITKREENAAIVDFEGLREAAEFLKLKNIRCLFS